MKSGFDDYAIINVPNEIIEMMLVDVINSSKNSAETNTVLSHTCLRFSDILKRKKDALIPHINMKFPFDSLPRFYDTIK